MTDRYGFELKAAKEIVELRTQARWHRHLGTGAEVLSLINRDENKVFGVTFRTPPADSTGVPHILEHSVLCGSKKYPVKEPFVELLKGSLQTFLNAFTYPDKTCYPVASQNLKDFYNLVDVYLDAVFQPRLCPEVLAQEGWHLDWPEGEARPTIKGVVYNEMKGAYSSADRLLIELSQRSLHPETTYGQDSGGDPRHIPDLDFSTFMDFYRRHYHPSNARFYFYGDDDPEQRLRLLAAVLDSYTAAPAAPAVAVQRPLSGPRRLREVYAVGTDAGAAAPSLFTVNWLLPPLDDPETEFALQALNVILVGLPASPLRKALIESGLGEDLAGVGLESELRQFYFSYGLKGVAAAALDRAERLLLDTLATIARDGIDPATVEAALNTIEFHLRENNSGNYPQGLVLMLRALTHWLHDRDPIRALAFEQPMAAVRNGWRNRPRYFESLLERWLIANPHRTTVVLEPDRDLGARLEAEERERIEALVSRMSESERSAAVAATRDLRRRQESPDSPEALATIPSLRLADLDRRNRSIPCQIGRHGGIPRLNHDLNTNGIVYLDLGFDLHRVPQHLLGYLPLFGRALLEMGTTEEDYVRLSQRIGRTTGGIRPQLLLAARRQGPTACAWLFLRAKAMTERVADLCRILSDVLGRTRFDLPERFRQLVLEAKARFEHQVIPNGHRLVLMRLNSHFSEAGRLAEELKGLNQLKFLRGLAERVEADWPGVAEELEALRTALLQTDAMIINATAEDPDLSRLDGPLDDLLSTLNPAVTREPSWQWEPFAECEGLTIPSQVSYVGKAADLTRLGYRFHGSALVVSHFLRTAWLWDRVRVRGGAYGAFSAIDRFTGVLGFASYRDPNFLETLEAFDQSAEYLCRLELSRDELRKAIIGVIGDLDQHQLPDARGFTALTQYLTGDDETGRQQLRDQVLATEAADFKAFGELLRGFKDIGLVKVLTAAGVVDQALAVRGRDWLKVTQVL